MADIASDIGKVEPISLTDEMQRSYLDYAMSVIVSRALPDVRDGLKPVQRRIIYAMHQQGLRHTARYQKSAAVVGEVLKNYHPHGDAAVYDAMVRMAQDFSLRYPLVDGQGNFGCFTKDTKVLLTDGRALSFEELIKEHAEGKRHWTFSYSLDEKKIKISEIQKPRLTIRHASLVEVILDNGEKTRCTPNHRFLLRNGSYREAQNLKPGDSLMPIYTAKHTGEGDKNMKDYSLVMQPANNQWEFIHHLSDEWNIENRIYDKKAGKVRHHVDFDKSNNNPNNIQRMQWADHWKLHAQLASWRHLHDAVYREKLAIGRNRYIQENKAVLAKRRSDLNRSNWQNPEYREQQISKIKKMWQNEEYKAAKSRESSERLKKLWEDPEFRTSVSSQKSEELQRKWQDANYRQKMSEHIRKQSLQRWSDPHYKADIVAKLVALTNDPEYRKRKSAQTKKLWENPNYRSKFNSNHFSQMAKNLWEDEETRKLHSEKAKKQWQDENFRNLVVKTVSKSNKKRLENNPHYMQELTLKAVDALKSNWKDENYKKKVIQSKTLRYVSQIQTQYPEVTPQLYEKNRTNNGTPKLENALRYFDNFNEILSQAHHYNHKVLTVRKLDVAEDVYDLTIDKYHNFTLASGIIVHNSVDGDSPAAMRYTEARLSAIADELLHDINKNTVDFAENYSGTTEEPLLLPAVIPNLLLNGASGIAVGMATQIPPHNLGEVTDALIYMIEHPSRTKKQSTNLTDGKAPEAETIDETEAVVSNASFSSEATVEDLIKFIKGPDFPTGASIYDQTEILNAYATGKGRIVMRAKAEIEETKGGRFDIIVTELPFQVNKAVLIARIADLVKDKKIDGIADLRDESDQKGMRIVVELKRDAKPQSVLNNLYKATAMQSVFNVNMVALSDGVPHLMTLKRILEEFVHHRQVVIVRRSEFELAEAKAREHILEGLKIAVDHIDAVIKTIRESEDADIARVNLMSRFKLTELQATAILDMQLRRLAALERQKIEDELKMVRETIAYLEDLLAHPEKILKVVKDEIKKVRERYADDRRTRVYKQKVGEFSEEDLVADELTVVTITQGGYVKRQLPGTFRTQARGGKGVSGITTKEEDTVSHIFYCKTLDNLLFFTDRGRVFQIKVWEIPESSRIAKGQAIVNLINVDQGEKITAILANRAKDVVKYLVMGTTQGNVKKTPIEEYANIRKNGLISIKLDQGDLLRWVVPTTGDNDVIIVSRQGQSIRINEKQVKPTHRDTSGVIGIKLTKGDEVVSLNLVKNLSDELLVVMEKGLGKKTKVSAWKIQNRGGSGIKAADITPKTGPIVTAKIIDGETDTLVMTSNKGQLIKLRIKDVPTLQRQTQGVILMRVRSGEVVAAATVVTSAEKTESEAQKLVELEK